MTDVKLSPKEYWDRNLAEARLPRENTRKHYHFRATMDFLESVLDGAGKRSFLEVGAGSSGWLPYFRRRFGYEVSGLDYSATGCELAARNMELLGLPLEEMICADVLAWPPGRSYDVIFTYGVIEHFSEPERVLRACAGRLAPGGILLTLVPNLAGLNGAVVRRLMPEVHAMHKVFSPAEFRRAHEAAGLSVLKAGYAGFFAPAAIPWAKSSAWILREGTLRRRLLLGLLNACSRLEDAALPASFPPPSALFSPYLMAAAVKPGPGAGGTP